MKNLFYIGLIFAVFSPVCPAGNPQVTLQLTGAVSGSIVIELYPDQAPVTVANFIDYVQNGYYDGLIFHRVISGFMVQGGGFDTDLNQQAPPHPAIVNESSNRVSNTRGTIAMARTGVADSATSQFYINLVDNYFLDYGYIGYDYNYSPPKQLPAQIGYCVFGEVISGIEVVDAVADVTTHTVNGMGNVPVDDIIIQQATVTHLEPVCAEKLPGDLNGDCRVDLADFVVFTDNWMACNSITPVCGQP